MVKESTSNAVGVGSTLIGDLRTYLLCGVAKKKILNSLTETENFRVEMQGAQVLSLITYLFKMGTNL